MLLGILGAASVSRVSGFEAIRSVLVHQTAAIPPSTAALLPRELERSRTHRTGGRDAGIAGIAGNADILVVQRAGLYLHSLLYGNRPSRQQQRPQQRRYHLGGPCGNGAGQGQLCTEDTAGVRGMWPLPLVRGLSYASSIW